MKRIKFYREENKWYVFLPEFPGDQDELEMVCGADTMLDIISQGEDHVYVTFSTTDKLRNCLILNHTDQSGGFYTLKTYNDIEYDLPVWLCNVTIYVFGSFPQIIYFQ